MQHISAGEEQGQEQEQPARPNSKLPSMLPGGGGAPVGFGADEAPPTSGDPNEEPDEPATEEEQAQYDLVVARAIKFMHGEGKKNVMNMLSSGAKPAEGVGTAAGNIIKMVEKSASQGGKGFSDGVLFHAGVEVVEELMELGELSGIFTFNSDEEAQQEMDESIMYALKTYGEGGLADGTIPQDEIDMSKKQMQEGVEREAQNGTAPKDFGGGASPVAQGVQQAMGGGQQPPAGLVNGARNQ